MAPKMESSTSYIGALRSLVENSGWFSENKNSYVQLPNTFLGTSVNFIEEKYDSALRMKIDNIRK